MNNRLEKYDHWIELFRDPVGWFSESSGPRVEVLNNDVNISELRKTVDSTADILKTAILTWENWLDGKSSRTELEKSFQSVEHVESFFVKYGLEYDENYGVNRPIRLIKTEMEHEKEKFGESFAFHLGLRIEQFKEWFEEEGEKFRIGVCHYESCRQFYVKRRSDSRYCSNSHASMAWQEAQT